MRPLGQQQRRRQQQAAPAKASKPDPWLSGTAPASTTALAMFQDPDRPPDKLSFGCQNLDAAFGGGVRVQGITEVYTEKNPPPPPPLGLCLLQTPSNDD